MYFTDSRTGVMKTTDRGANWHDSNLGLTGMRCASLAVSANDPLRVYAGFHGWGGVYISDDGTSHWTYAPIEDSGQIWTVLQDPFDTGLVYAIGGGFYRSTDDGKTWPGRDWTLLLPPGSPSGLMGFAGSAAVDPFDRGHLLVASRVGQSTVHDHDLGYLYSSDDWGTTWHPVVVAGTPGSIGPIGAVVFDPESPGTVYLTSDGNGVFKSTDHGATWARIDDPARHMEKASSLTVATHPQHALAVLTQEGLFTSLDDGDTWRTFGGAGFDNGIPVTSYSFIDADSTRLYASTYAGLYFSPDLGATWAPSAGALGDVQVTTVAGTEMDGHTLLYAATTGGDTAAIWNPSSVSSAAGASVAGTSRAALADTPADTLVAAGIYRRAQIETSATFASGGSRDGWILESSEHSGRGGSLSSGSTTLRLGDNASRKQYRSVLSFSTGSGLPDGAVITGVTLRVRRNGVTGGGDPIAKFKGFAVDVKRGYFGTRTTLQTSDFQASGSRSFSPVTPALTDGWYSIELPGAGAYVNKRSTGGGLTQVRLRFKTDDNNNRTANYLRAYSGDVSTASRPQLVITYYVP